MCTKDLKTIKYAFKSSLPVMAGYLFIGLGFGVLMATHGYGPMWALVMSIVVYAGTMQYLAVDLLATGASLVTTAIMTLMVNVRHLFYAISMVGPYKDMGRAKTYLACALTDETYALVCQMDLPEDIDRKKYCLALSLMDHSYWVIGSLLGDIIGVSVNFDFTGIDFGMTAMFVAIATDQWLKTKNHWAAMTGLVSSIVCLVIWGPESFLIPTMIIITIALGIERAAGLLPRHFDDASAEGGGADD